MASCWADPLIALLVVPSLAAILGIAPVDRLAAGLNDAGVIPIAGMLVIARGAVQTGVVSRMTFSHPDEGRCERGSRQVTLERR